MPSIEAYQHYTLVDLLAWHARCQPDRPAFVFLADGETLQEQLTYAQLDRRARALATSLQTVAQPGDRALLLYPPGLDYLTAFFGCLYAGVVAVPAYPPHPARAQRMLPRLAAIMQDSQPVAALTHRPVLATLEALGQSAPALTDMQWLATEAQDAAQAEHWTRPPIDRTTTAFLQYTSGSTSAPRGVVVRHSNLLYNLEMLRHGFGNDEATTFVSWLPLYHDMGLIGAALASVYVGATAILMAPAAFLQRPYRWLQAITRYRARTSGAPNFAYDLCVRKITDEQKRELDLTSWRVAFNGAEPIRHATLQRFVAAFAPCGFRPNAFYPCYGLAEATLFVAGGDHTALPVTGWFDRQALAHNRVYAVAPDHPQAQPLVSSGRSWLDQQIAIVDPASGQPSAPDTVGEVWVAGSNVAQGYFNRDAHNREIFGARLAGHDRPFLRTGDLGFLRDEQLFITGRLKDLIIIGGRNYYPQDLELTAEQSHPALRPGCCAAFSIDDGEQECLALAIEVDPQHPQAQPELLVRAIRRAIAQEYDLQVQQVALLEPFSIPKTSSGKIQRHASRAQLLDGSLRIWGAAGHDSAA